MDLAKYEVDVCTSGLSKGGRKEEAAINIGIQEG
jgi:hypothetical protein